MKRLAAVAALALALAGCKSDGGGSKAPDLGSQLPPVVTTPTPPAATTYDVDPCLVQQVYPGTSVASLVIPDTLTLDFSRPSTFPNGRQLADPVIDRTLAMVLLDLTSQSIDRFHDIPLDPPSNDKPFRADFPYLAAPFGNPPVPQGGSSFNFRTDSASAYVRVDRMGMPAIATALISSAHKNAYNDDSPKEDLTYKWVPEIRTDLTEFTDELVDDLAKLNLKICAKPKG